MNRRGAQFERISELACIGAHAIEGRSWLWAIGRDHLSQIRQDFGREHELGHDSPLREVASSPDKTLTRAHAPSDAWSNSDLRPRNDRQTLDMDHHG
jgi:hypothetical protein